MRPRAKAVHLTFSPTKDNRLLTLAGRLENYFLAIDLRLQSHRWMNDFAAKGRQGRDRERHCAAAR